MRIAVRQRAKRKTMLDIAVRGARFNGQIRANHLGVRLVGIADTLAEACGRLVTALGTRKVLSKPIDAL
jgi:hypothetical protein